MRRDYASTAEGDVLGSVELGEAGDFVAGFGFDPGVGGSGAGGGWGHCCGWMGEWGRVVGEVERRAEEEGRKGGEREDGDGDGSWGERALEAEISAVSAGDAKRWSTTGGVGVLGPELIARKIVAHI